MKYLHIMLANGSSTYKFIRGLFNSLPREEFFEHEFIISESLNFVVKNAPYLLVYNYDNVNFLPVKGKKTAKLRLELMKEKMEQAELIVWHSLLPMNTLKKAKLANRFCYKSVWVTMVGDRTKPNINSRNKDVKKLAREKLKFMKAVKYVNCSFPWFMKSFTQDYGDHKLVSEIPYPIDSRHLEAMKNCCPDQCDRLKIIVGYNGGTINKHETLFTYLKLKPDDDFRIIMPMNFATYGEWGITERWQYRDRVLQNGVNRFGAEKVIKLRRKNVVPEEYFRMYASCDIGVFNDNRPLGMILLFYMLYMGKKVFLKGSSVLVSRLRSLYLPVYSLAELKKMNAQELKAPVCDEDYLDMYRIEQRLGKPLTSLVEEEGINRIYKWNKPSAQKCVIPEEGCEGDEAYEIYFKPMTPEEQAEISRRRALGRKWLESYMSVSETMARWLAWLESIRNGRCVEDKFDMNVMEELEYDEQTSG